MVVLAHPSWAETEIKCNPAGNQLQLNACALNDFATADAELNSVYQQLVKKMADDPEFIKKLHTAEKAWIVFRDADLGARFACAEEDARQCWGSIYPMSFLGRKTELTKTRVKQLTELLRDGIGQ